MTKPSRNKTREDRRRLRAQGLRSVEIWEPDVRSESFLAETHPQSLAVTASPDEPDDQAFIDAVSDWPVS